VAVAAVVAALVVVVNLGPISWAAPQPAGPAIPALPPSELAISSLGAKVLATATPMPGQTIRVKLSLVSSPEQSGKSVPVTVAINRRTMVMREMMSRGPSPRQLLIEQAPSQAPKQQVQVEAPELAAAKNLTQVGQVSATLVIGKDGTASATVDFANLTWATPSTQPETTRTRDLATYEISLSSPLANAAAVALPPVLAPDGQQQ
jgi:hypothetical protein